MFISGFEFAKEDGRRVADKFHVKKIFYVIISGIVQYRE